MGQHKYNPTAIAAKKGELPPKEKSNLSKRQREALLRKIIQEKTGLPAMVRALGGKYFYL